MTKTYERHLPGYWVLLKGTWFIFFLREVTCLFVIVGAYLFLQFARSIAAGPEAYAEFTTSLRTPGMVTLVAATFVSVVWHTITWFVAAPKAMRPQIGDQLVPGSAIIGGHYLGWFAVSAILYWVLT